MIVVPAPWLPKGIKGFGGIAPFAFIHPDHIHDPTVIEHERVHNQQCRRRWWVGFWIRYLRSKEWRYLYELEGYRMSYKCGRPLESCAKTLWFGYAAHTFRSMAQVRQELEADTMPDGYY